MNLTNIGNIPSRNWRRLTTQSISTAAGMALVVSAVVAFGSSTSGSTAVAPSRETPLTVSGEPTYETVQDYAVREQAVLATYRMAAQP